jgi:hypothetical protein
MIRTPDELERALDELHDRWFDLEALKFKEDERRLALPFWSRLTKRSPRDRKTGQQPAFDRRLVVSNVIDYSIEDRERIAIYGFNRVKYEDFMVTVTAEPYLTIMIRVSELNLVIENVRADDRSTE